MKATVTEPRVDIKNWVLSKIEFPFWVADEDCQFALGLLEDGQPIGGAILHNFTELKNGGEIQMTLAGLPGKLWLTPKVIRFVMQTVFEDFNCTRLVVSVDSRNLASKKIIEKFGFIQEGCFRERAGGPGKDVYLYCMLKHECRWLSTHDSGD